jgi:hypothetical protein
MTKEAFEFLKKIAGINSIILVSRYPENKIDIETLKKERYIVLKQIKSVYEDGKSDIEYEIIVTTKGHEYLDEHT